MHNQKPIYISYAIYRVIDFEGYNCLLNNTFFVVTVLCGNFIYEAAGENQRGNQRTHQNEINC